MFCDNINLLRMCYISVLYSLSIASYIMFNIITKPYQKDFPSQDVQADSGLGMAPCPNGPVALPSTLIEQEVPVMSLANVIDL